MGCGVVQKHREYNCVGNSVKYTTNDPDMCTLPRIIAIFSKRGGFSQNRVENAMSIIDGQIGDVAFDRANVFNITLLYFSLLCANNNRLITSILRSIPDDCATARDMLLAEITPDKCC